MFHFNSIADESTHDVWALLSRMPLRAMVLLRSAYDAGRDERVPMAPKKLCWIYEQYFLNIKTLDS
jgi:hypothetical protein